MRTNQQKTARTTAYHVARSEKREDILQNGLRADGPIYLWGHPSLAAKYVGYKSTDYDPIDVWLVDASGLPLEPDPFFKDEEGETRTWGYGNPAGQPDAWRYHGPISPDRLTLIEQDLTRIERHWNEFPRGWTTQMNPRTQDFERRMDEFPFQTQSNILDPIQPELDQKVFRGTDLREFHRLYIMRLYQRALRQEFGVMGEGWADLYLTGSLTTYQYSETSDADTSVFANWDRFYNELGIEADEARKRLIALSIEHIDGTFLPGTTHPLQFFVVPSGTLPSDLYQPGLRSAYSLDDDMWFQEPEKDRVHDIAVEMPDVFERAVEMADKMRQMLDHDPEQARQLWHDIHKKRQLDQRAGLGDFCEGNVVYKYLLNQGLFDRIKSELGEYIAKTGEFDFDNIAVRKSVELSYPWDDDDPEDYENYMHDMHDVHDEENPVEAAAELLQNEGLTEFSSSPNFVPNGWYSNPDGGNMTGRPHGFTEQEEREIWAIIRADDFRNQSPDAPPLGHPLDWTAKVGARPENYDPWANGGAPPYALEDVGPGGLEEHIKELAAKNNVEVKFDAGQPNQFRHEEEWAQYQGRPDNPFMKDTIHIFPIEDNPYRYFAALHELAHIEFRRRFKQPEMTNSSEEESWCWAWAVEHSEVALPPEVLYQAHGYWEGYDVDRNMPTYAPYKSDWFRWPMDFERHTGAAWSEGWQPEMPMNVEQKFVRAMECPWDQSHLKQSPQGIYCPTCGWQPRVKEAFIDPEDAYFYEDPDEEPDMVRRHEYWRTFWIDPQEIYDGGQRVHVMLNSDEVDVGDPVTVKWESRGGRMKADGVVEYIVDQELADEAFSQNRPVSDWASVIRIDLDSMQPIVYAKVAEWPNRWWNQPQEDLSYQLAAPILQEAEQYLTQNYANMTNDDWSKYFSGLMRQISQAWQQLPVEMEPEYPGMFTKPWAELAPLNQRLRSEEDYEAMRNAQRDKWQWYREMDPGDIMQATDMFWDFYEYWKGKVLEESAAKRQPDSTILKGFIDDIRKAFEEGRWAEGAELSIQVSHFIDQELADFESYKTHMRQQQGWEDAYDTMKKHLGDKYSVLTSLGETFQGLSNQARRYAGALESMQSWDFDYEQFTEKLDFDVALENIEEEKAERMKTTWMDVEEQLEKLWQSVAFAESRVLELQDLEGQAEVPDTFPQDWLARRMAATDHLWDERVTTKVVYDFDTDRLFLGTMADIPNLPSNKVIGEYADDVVEIFETEKQWVSPTYFKRLWHHSFPNKPLDGVYFRQADGERFRLDRMRKREQDG